MMNSRATTCSPGESTPIVDRPVNIRTHLLAAAAIARRDVPLTEEQIVDYLKPWLPYNRSHWKQFEEDFKYRLQKGLKNLERNTLGSHVTYDVMVWNDYTRDVEKLLRKTRSEHFGLQDNSEWRKFFSYTGDAVTIEEAEEEELRSNPGRKELDDYNYEDYSNVYSGPDDRRRDPNTRESSTFSSYRRRQEELHEGHQEEPVPIDSACPIPGRYSSTEVRFFLIDGEDFDELDDENRDEAPTSSRIPTPSRSLSEELDIEMHNDNESNQREEDNDLNSREVDQVEEQAVEAPEDQVKEQAAEDRESRNSLHEDDDDVADPTEYRIQRQTRLRRRPTPRVSESGNNDDTREGHGVALREEEKEGESPIQRRDTPSLKESVNHDSKRKDSVLIDHDEDHDEEEVPIDRLRIATLNQEIENALDEDNEDVDVQEAQKKQLEIRPSRTATPHVAVPCEDYGGDDADYGDYQDVVDEHEEGASLNQPDEAEADEDGSEGDDEEEEDDEDEEEEGQEGDREPASSHDEAEAPEAAPVSPPSPSPPRALDGEVLMDNGVVESPPSLSPSTCGAPIPRAGSEVIVLDDEDEDDDDDCMVVGSMHYVKEKNMTREALEYRAPANETTVTMQLPVTDGEKPPVLNDGEGPIVIDDSDSDIEFLDIVVGMPKKSAPELPELVLPQPEQPEQPTQTGKDPYLSDYESIPDDQEFPGYVSHDDSDEEGFTEFTKKLETILQERMEKEGRQARRKAGKRSRFSPGAEEERHIMMKHGEVPEQAGSLASKRSSSSNEDEPLRKRFSADQPSTSKAVDVYEFNEEDDEGQDQAGSTVKKPQALKKATVDCPYPIHIYVGLALLNSKFGHANIAIIMKFLRNYISHFGELPQSFSKSLEGNLKDNEYIESDEKKVPQGKKKNPVKNPFPNRYKIRPEKLEQLKEEIQKYDHLSEEDLGMKKATWTKAKLGQLKTSRFKLTKAELEQEHQRILQICIPKINQALVNHPHVIVNFMERTKGQANHGHERCVFCNKHQISALCTKYKFLKEKEKRLEKLLRCVRCFDYCRKNKKHKHNCSAHYCVFCMKSVTHREAMCPKMFSDPKRPQKPRQKKSVSL